MNNFFTGVVEDINDPEQMGRVRVRCFGYHTDDKQLIPTDSLPWSHVVTPITNAAMTGIGTSATGILQGTWVVGVFRDQETMQDPLILGTLPSRNYGENPAKGFSDPDGAYPHRPGEIDTPKQSTSEFNSSKSYINREDVRQENIEIAIVPNLSTVDASAIDEKRSSWSVPHPDDYINPVYPKNHSTQTESGHVFEVDDTIGSERIFSMHRSGTYNEMMPDGSETIVIRSKKYEVVFSDSNLYIKGNCNLTIDGDVRTLVKGSYHLEIEGDYTQNIKGSVKTKIGGSELKEIDNEYSDSIGSNRYTHTVENQIDIIDGNKDLIVNGNNDTTIVGDQFLSVGGDDAAVITKDSLKTINGNKEHFVMGKSNNGVSGDHSLTVSGNNKISTGRNLEIKTLLNQTVGIGENLSEDIKGSQDVSIGKSLTELITGSQETKASTININGGADITAIATTINLNPKSDA